MSDYPTDAQQWRDAIAAGLDIDEARGRARHASGQLPVDQIDAWIEATYAEGFHPQFVLALRRNLRGLLDWAYGDGGEPHWPGSDDDQEPG